MLIIIDTSVTTITSNKWKSSNQINTGKHKQQQTQAPPPIMIALQLQLCYRGLC